MSPSFAFFVLVVLLVVGWFALGTHYNVRKGHQFMRWLQEGLPLLGEKTTLRWLGSSVLELKIQQPKPPFRSAEILAVFEPRDVAPVWLFSRLRGRRDLFILRATLRRRPSVQLEAFSTTAWPPHSLSERAKNSRWASLPIPAPLVAYAPPGASNASEVLATATLDACQLQLLTSQNQEPNVELQWLLTPLCKQSARVVFETVLRVAERL